MYGLVGRDLSGSASAAWFADRGIDYRNFELADISELPELLIQHPDLQGFNVTSPYKEAVMPFLDSLDPVAAEVGAVNCVVRTSVERLVGHNTDAPALKDEFAEFIGGRSIKALVLGTGGAAKAAAWALDALNVDFMTVSRTAGDMAYANMTPEIIGTHHLIINATPLGMGQLMGEKPPIIYHALTPQHLLFDMVYNPPQTPFLVAGLDYKAQIRNGWGMLVRQAEMSRKIWQAFAGF